jgi:hypothetical protein
MLTLQELFSSFTDSAFRFEALPAYLMQDEVSLLEAYQRRDPCPPEPRGEWAEWLLSLREWSENGKCVRRVRMLPANPTTYVKCELDWGYPVNVKAGENIRIIGETEVLKLAAQIPRDFWLFDSKAVAILKYSEKGEWLGAEILESGVKPYIRLAESLWRISEPLHSSADSRFR